jgi:hypothetical protein
MGNKLKMTVKTVLDRGLLTVAADTPDGPLDGRLRTDAGGSVVEQAWTLGGEPVSTELGEALRAWAEGREQGLVQEELARGADGRRL